LGERLAHDDRDAAAEYVLGIVSAHPSTGGSGPAARADDAAESVGGVTSTASPAWATAWTEATHRVLDVPLDDLGPPDDDARLDLRVAMVTHTPQFYGHGLQWLRGVPAPLAAAMSVHDVQLREPAAIAQAVNAVVAKERALEFGQVVDDLPELSAGELTAATPASVPAPLRELAQASRSHLLDLAQAAAAPSPLPADQFGTFHRTRLIGCDGAESVAALRDAGLVAASGDRVALTDRGREVADWLTARVVETGPMWAAWCALRFPVWPEPTWPDQGWE
jgi:hypothetical protein